MNPGALAAVHSAVPGSLPPVFDHAWFFFAYLFVDALAFPLGSTVYVMYFGTHHSPVWTALLGAVATTLGSIVQYGVVRGLVTRPGTLPRWALRWRVRIERGIEGSTAATFWALFVIYATPLGAGPLRIVAAVGGFPLGRFALAILLGCLPYYFALAWFGHAVRLPVWVYVGALIALLALGLAQWLSRRARTHAARSGRDPA